MNLFLIFFAFFPRQLSAKPLFNDAFLMFNLVLLYASLALYFLAIFLSFCFCLPRISRRPKCVSVLLQILASTVLLVASCLGIVGTDFLTYQNDDKNRQSQFSTNLYDFTRDNNMKNIYENITKNNLYSITSTKLLINLTTQYNSTFSDENSIYRTSFNHLYFNPDINNFLKVSLRNMDISRNNILTQIQTFASKSQQFFNGIKKILTKIKKCHFTPQQKSHKILSFNFDYPKGKIEIIGNMFIAELSYTIASVAILMPVLYTLVFFLSNDFSRKCFCIYPIFAFIIAFSTFFSCYYITRKDYKPWKDHCSIFEYNTKNQLHNFSNSSFEIELNQIFNEKKINEIGELIDKINSRNVHVDYKQIYNLYYREKNYEKELNRMVNIIESNEVKLFQMKELIENISDIFNSFNRTLENQQNNLSIKNVLLSSSWSSSSSIFFNSEFCDRYLDGINFCVLGQFFLQVGLLLTFLSVCLRRRNMRQVFVNDKYYDSSSGSNSLSFSASSKYIMGDEVQDVYNFNISSDDDDGGGGKNKKKSIEDLYPHLPMSIDECKCVKIKDGLYKTNLGVRLSYHATSYEAAKCILRDSYLVKGKKGMFGAGIYFAATMEIAKHKSRSKVGAYVIAKVNFGTALILSRPHNNLTFEDVKKYGCDSVMGRRAADGHWEFIVYESNRTYPLQMFRLKQKEIDSDREEEPSEDYGSDSDS